MAKTLKFPDGFLWGAATSSYQVEGGIENNDWAFAAQAGKVPHAREACDHYNRFEHDFDIAHALGHNAHRLSIEWSRIEPEEGHFSEKEIAHYRRVLRALKARGMTPFVTLWHFTLPIWLSKTGGAQNRDFPEYFARYCAFVAQKLDFEHCFVITINEPLVFSSIGWVRGSWPPFKKRAYMHMHGVNKNLVKAHIRAYTRMKELLPQVSIGIAKHNKNVRTNKNPINMLAGYFADWYWNVWFLNRVRGTFDFIGLNYYYHLAVGFDESEFERTDFNWPITPQGLYSTLLELKRYRKPLYITENGLADIGDSKRAQFIRDHLYWVYQAIEKGVDVRGYLHWSLLDNFEWAGGFQKRFGLVGIDFTTQRRTVRSSAYEYKKICESNELVIS